MLVGVDRVAALLRRLRQEPFGLVVPNRPDADAAAFDEFFEREALVHAFSEAHMAR